MNISNICGTVAIITSLIGLLPQIYKTYKTKSAKDISMLMLFNYLICAAAWAVHGIYIDSYFVIFSNVKWFVTVCILIFQKRYYDKNYPAVS